MAGVTTVSDLPSAPDPERRLAMLQRIADYVLENGLSDLSLRPLASALGTSGRMLIYYFGSKDRLLVDTLDEIRRQKYEDLGLRSGGEDVLPRYWKWATSGEGQRYLRLVYEVYGLSLRDPDRFGSFLAAETADVLDVIGTGFRDGGVSDRDAVALSTYTFAALRGLELDLLATGDLQRANNAFDMFETDLQRRVDVALNNSPAKHARRSKP